MFQVLRSRRAVVAFAFALVFGAGARQSIASGGHLLAPADEPKGYSLSRMAVLTAVFNTGQQSGNPLTPPPPDVPFCVLVSDATVKRGTMFYLPIYFTDNSGGTPPGFPKNLDDQEADAKFLDSAYLSAYNITNLIVEVDGRTTYMKNDYVVGVKTKPLLDGTPAGTSYIVSAAFLTPLSPGDHTVAIGGIIEGVPVIFLTYNVTVR